MAPSAGACCLLTRSKPKELERAPASQQDMSVLAPAELHKDANWPHAWYMLRMAVGWAAITTFRGPT